MWRIYNILSELNYNHLIVNHSIEFVNRETGCHTNTIEANCSALKRYIPPTDRRKKFINIYIGRFMWQRNEGNEIIKILEFLFNNN